MAKVLYKAIDPNGVVHTRKSARTYTHTVVAQYNKAVNLARANDKEWTKTDGRSYDYYVKIATGNDPYPQKNYSGTAEEQAEVDANNAKRVADAKARIDGLTRDEYIAKELAGRIAAVEATDFEEWHNLGWCGRIDLAQKLASGAANFYHNATILEAGE